jgi:hypothetical protein
MSASNTKQTPTHNKNYHPRDLGHGARAKLGAVSVRLVRQRPWLQRAAAILAFAMVIAISSSAHGG